MSQAILSKIEVLQARIAKDTADLGELQARLAAAAQLDSVTAGYVVTFKVGRADTRREVEGTVLGRAVIKDVDTVRCAVGEGFEQELFNVAVAQLLSVKAPGSDEPAAEPVPGNDDDLLNSIHG